MAHVCFVSTVHNVYDHRFLYKECAALVEAGHDVSFMVPHEADCTLHGVRVIAGRQVRNRLVRILRSPLMIPKMLRADADAYHICNIELLPAGLVVKLLSRKVVVYDNHEDFASYMLIKTYLWRPVAYLCKWAVQVFEWLAGWRLDGFVAADPAVASGYPQLPEARKSIFYNVPPLKLFGPNPVPWRDRKYDVTLLGSMSRTSGTVVLLEALAELQRRGRPIRALFIGKPNTEEILRAIDELGLAGSVEITGRVTYDKVPALLDECRIGLIGLLDLPKFHKNIATKMFEYWAKSMPVVSADLPPERAFLVHGKHGLLVEPGPPAAFADAIAYLLDHPEESERIGAEGRRLIETQGYYAERQQARFAEFYARLLAHPR